MKKLWQLTLDGTPYTVQCKVSRASGEFDVKINREFIPVSPQQDEEGFLTVLFPVGDHEAKLLVKGRKAQLFVDDHLMNPLSSNYTAANVLYKDPNEQRRAMQDNKVKAAHAAFFTLVMFTYVNVFAIFFDADFNFPFSVSLPWLAWGEAMYWGASWIAGFVVALLVSTVFLVLYLLSKKRTVPVIITIVLMFIDTALLALSYMNDLSFGMDGFALLASGIIDLLFHVWVTASLIQLLIAQKKYKKMFSNIDEASDAAAEESRNTSDITE